MLCDTFQAVGRVAATQNMRVFEIILAKWTGQIRAQSGRDSDSGSRSSGRSTRRRSRSGGGRTRVRMRLMESARCQFRVIDLHLCGGRGREELRGEHALLLLRGRLRRRRRVAQILRIGHRLQPAQRFLVRRWRSMVATRRPMLGVVALAVQRLLLHALFLAVAVTLAIRASSGAASSLIVSRVTVGRAAIQKHKKTGIEK